MLILVLSLSLSDNFFANDRFFLSAPARLHWKVLFRCQFENAAAVTTHWLSRFIEREGGGGRRRSFTRTHMNARPDRLVNMRLEINTESGCVTSSYTPDEITPLVLHVAIF